MVLGFVSWRREDEGFAQDPQTEGSHLPRDELEDRQKAVVCPQKLEVAGVESGTCAQRSC